MKVRRASATDVDALRNLLKSLDLPTADLSPDLGPFLLAEAEGMAVACAGLEQHQDVGLLRSVAVLPPLRGRGIAIRLCSEILEIARGVGVQQIYLLTVTASGFFEKIGFLRIPRGEAPAAIRGTREFRELCPDTSALMRRAVGRDSASPAVDRLRDAYAAFARGDPAALLALLTSETVYHLPGAHLGGGRLEGRAAIVRRLVAAGMACDAPPEVELLQTSGDDMVVVTRERFRAQRCGRSLDQEVHVAWRFAQAQCVEIWSHFEDQVACDAFWKEWTAEP